MNEINLLETTDAQIWAKEFIKTAKKNNWTLEDIDEGLMISWFANAMAAQEFKDHPALTASQEREREIRKHLEHIVEYWNRDRNDEAMHNALWHIIETAEQALSSPPSPFTEVVCKESSSCAVECGHKAVHRPDNFCDEEHAECHGLPDGKATKCVSSPLTEARESVRLPTTPTKGLLRILNTPKWPEDWEEGKILQKQVGLDVVPPNTEMEITAGVYSRLVKALKELDP